MSQSLFDQPKLLVLVRMLHADQADVLNKKAEKGSTLYYVHYLQRGCAACIAKNVPTHWPRLHASALCSGKWLADKADQLPFA